MRNIILSAVVLLVTACSSFEPEKNMVSEQKTVIQKPSYKLMPSDYARAVEINTKGSVSVYPLDTPVENNDGEPETLYPNTANNDGSMISKHSGSVRLYDFGRGATAPVTPDQIKAR